MRSSISRRRSRISWFILQAPVDVLLERIAKRGIRYEQQIERAYLERPTKRTRDSFMSTKQHRC